MRKSETENRGQILECGLRPVGAIGAYGPEGRRKRKQSVFQWLIGMKSRFIEKKVALKAVSLDYRKGGSWIKPQN